MLNEHNDPLFELIEPQRLTAIVDIGANPIDGEPPYKEMLDNELCTVLGFEPQASALERLNREKGQHEEYLPFAIGNGEQRTLHICKASGMSSLLRPDVETLALFNEFAELGTVLATQALETHRLDDITEIETIDLLKIDAQGSELPVFEYGRKKLAEAVAIQTEISFVPLYEQQPTLGEIDLELRSQGFIPHAFAGVKRWPISPMVINKNPRHPLRQLLEADLVYVRDFRQPDTFSDEQLKHLGLIAHHCYRSFDLAMRCLVILEQRGTVKPNSQQNYFSLLNQYNLTDKNR